MPRPKTRPARSPSTTSEDDVTTSAGSLDLSNGSTASSFSTEEHLSTLFDRLNSYIDATDPKPKQIFRDLGKAPINTRKAMFDLLVDNKESIAPLLNERAEIVRKQNSQSEKLDNMLFDCLAGAELGPPSPEPGEPEPPNDGEYKYQLQAIKIKHTEMLEELEESRGEAELKIEKMVDLQIPFRPISKEDHKRMIETSTARYSDVEERMKKSTVNAVMLINNKCLDARRRRRNFTKETTEILTEWFQQHLNHPYPTDEEKNLLSYQCNISVQQITNWFGNRRVRQKRQADRPLQPPSSSPKRKDSSPKSKNHLKGNRAPPRLEKQRRMSSPGPRQILAVPLQQQQHLMLQQGLLQTLPSMQLPTPSSLRDHSYHADQFEPQGAALHPANLLMSDHYRLDHSIMDDRSMAGSQEMTTMEQVIGDKSYTDL